uniref:Co-chaperone protein p23 n=1 Tax=Brassica oleracea var. oleracea TaxID=109376 RepID=A0A0D3E026_BRAOL
MTPSSSSYSAKAGHENHVYELKLELHDKVNVEESKINIGVRNIFCIIEKAEPERWNKLIRGGKAPHYVKVDWDKWVDEDDEGNAGAGDMDLGGMGGMDFSNFGGMGGMEGLGGMGGLGGIVVSCVTLTWTLAVPSANHQMLLTISRRNHQA